MNTNYSDEWMNTEWDEYKWLGWMNTEWDEYKWFCASRLLKIQFYCEKFRVKMFNSYNFFIV